LIISRERTDGVQASSDESVLVGVVDTDSG
jgi:hypothetical protein